MRPTSLHDSPPEAAGSGQHSWHAGAERRKSARASLHWTLYLNCEGAGEPVRTVSRDISPDGFYCLLNQSVKPGERIQCDIVLPTHSLHEPGEVAYLHCNAQAVRVERLGSGAEFGLACRVDDYSLVHFSGTNLRRETGADTARRVLQPDVERVSI